MSEETQGIEEELGDEVARRLAIMEDPSYEFPKRITKVDWTLIITIVVVCLCLLVYGALGA